MLCKELGRHRHIDYCRKELGRCPERGVEHITGAISPDPDKPKDFVEHHHYWERTGFEGA